MVYIHINHNWNLKFLNRKVCLPPLNLNQLRPEIPIRFAINFQPPSNHSKQTCRVSIGTFVSAGPTVLVLVRNVAFPAFTAASPSWVQVSRVPRPDRRSLAPGMGSPLQRGHFGSQAEGLVSGQQNSQWGKSTETTEVRATASFQPADICEARSPHNKNTLGKCLVGVVCLNWPDESHFDWGTAILHNGSGQFQGRGRRMEGMQEGEYDCVSA